MYGSGSGLSIGSSTAFEGTLENMAETQVPLPSANTSRSVVEITMNQSSSRATPMADCISSGYCLRHRMATCQVWRNALRLRVKRLLLRQERSCPKWEDVEGVRGMSHWSQQVAWESSNGFLAALGDGRKA